MMPGVIAVQQELWDTIFNGTDFANGIEFDSTNDNTLILNSNIGDNTVSSPNNSNSMVFVNDGVSNACIRYCTIDGTNGPGDGNGVQLSSVTGSTGFKIEKLYHQGLSGQRDHHRGISLGPADQAQRD